METEIVGRDEELGVLTRVLERGSEEAVACTIEGEAGVGKTALWTWAIAAARDRGYRVLSARPAEAEASFSFSALGDLLRHDLDDVVAQLPLQQRRALEAALLIGDTEGPTVDAHAVAVAALSTIELLAKGQPLVIGVDDVQWLDGPSSGVFRFAARRLPPRTCFLIAERIGSGSAQFGLDGERIRLGALSVGALHRLVQQRLDVPLPRPTLLRLHEATGGNALYALEFARTLADSGRALAPGEPLPVPETLRDVVAQRLAQISSFTRTSLLMVAASAQPSRYLLQQRALDEAMRADVLVLEGDRLRFAHPLFGSVLYAGASQIERRDVHAQLASVVEDVEEAARHLALAVERPDESVAVRLEHAAAHARTRGAPSAAAELMEQAVELTPPSREGDRVRRTVDAAELHHEARSGAAEPLLESVLPQTAGNLRARALRLLAFHRGLAYVGSGVPLFEEALEHVDDPLLEAQIRLALVNPFLSPMFDGANAHAERAVELAEQVGQPGLLAAALASRANLQEHRRKDLELAVRLEEAEGGGFLARLLHAQTSLEAGKADGARAFLDRLHEEARTSGLRQENWVLTLLVRAEAFAGNFRRAKDVAEYFLLFPQQEGNILGKAAAHGDRAMAEAYLGEVEAARSDAMASMQFADTAGFVGRSIFGRWVLGFVELSLGDTAAAWKHFEAAIAQFSPTVERTWPSIVSLLTVPLLFVDATEGLVALGRQAEASPFLEWLERDRGNPLRQALSAHCRGLVAEGFGSEERTLAELADAVEQLEQLSLPFQLARALLALGAAQRRARRKREARESLSQALEIFEQVESPLWTEKARRELARIGGRTASPGELTGSEQRIAALVAEGKTNKEVAAELVVTPRTIEAALTRIYAKLGIRSRTELARRMAEPSEV